MPQNTLLIPIYLLSHATKHTAYSYISLESCLKTHCLLLYISLEPEGESDDCEPDLHQCGKCKRMFSMLEKYLQHRANKSCRKRHADSIDVMSDEGGSPRQAPEIVQVRAG